MTKYNTIPNDDEPLLAKKPRFKGLIFGAAAASFVLSPWRRPTRRTSTTVFTNCAI